MKKNSESTSVIKRILAAIAVAIAIAVLLTVLSAVPPLSMLYQRLASKNLGLVWTGITAGIIAFSLIWLSKKERHKK